MSTLELPDELPEPVGRLADYWWVVVPYAATMVLLLVVTTASLRNPSPPPLTNDGGFFLYSGVAMAEGALPYRDIWDVKPPAIHETVALAALATGGDRVLVYLVTTSVTAVAVAVSCTFLAVVVYDVTGSELGAFVAGFAPLTHRANYLLVPSGIRPKYFLVLFGLAAVYFALDRRPFLAGLAGGLAASYWQPGVVFAAVAVGAFAVTEDGSLDLSRRTWTAVGGVASAALAVLAPFVLGGGVAQLFDQVVVTPLLLSSGGGPLDNVRSLLDTLRYAWFVPLVGLLGAGTVVGDVGDPEFDHRLAVLVAPVGWFALVALLDFQGSADAIPLVFVSGLGAGLFVGRSGPVDADRFPVERGDVLLAALVVASSVLMLPWVDHADPDVGAGDSERFGVAYLHGVDFRTCHVRLSSIERDWIRRYGADPYASRCRVHWLSGGPG